MHFDALGTLEARDGGMTVDLGPPQRRAVLAVLLLAANRPVHTDRLIDAVWDGGPPPNATGALHVHLSRLRSVLGAQHVLRRTPGYMLCAGPDDVAVTVFEQLADSGRRALATGDVERAGALLGEALALWRGQAYEDFIYADWSRAERARLDELRLLVHVANVDANLELGNHAALVPDLELLVGSHPTHERFCAQHMLALYRSHRQVDALDVFKRHRKILRDEHGLDPSPELRELERRILDQDDGLLLLSDDGPRPNPIVNGPDTITGSVREPPRSRLPTPLTRFIGRSAEVSTVSALLSDHRLVTIVGPGGAGKSRLALEVARRTTRPDGTWWVDLSRSSGLVDIVATIWTSLGFIQPPSTGSVHALADVLEHRDLMVVLDCCEPVAEDVPEVIWAILESCPQVHMLCTSRQRLHIAGERVWPIPLLTLPERADLQPDEFGSIDALALFADRAQAADYDFQLSPENMSAVAQICHAVDGLPLGIEIAAANIGASTPNELLARFENRLTDIESHLHGVPDRHRTLTDTIRWSYGMLEPAEQLLLDQLSLVEAPIRPTDVIAIGFAPADAAADTLAGLADKSLLVRVRDGEETDYRMLDTVRAFAEAQLRVRDDRAYSVETFARHFAGIAVAGQNPAMDEMAWIRSMRKCERNIERAVAWCVDNDPELGAEAFIGAYLYTRWITGGWPSLESSATSISQIPALSETKRLHVLSCLLGVRTSRPPSADMVAAARAVAESPHAPPDAVIYARNALARLAHFGHGDDLRRAYELFSVAPFQLESDEHCQVQAHVNEVLSYLDGNIVKARSHILSSLRLDRARGYKCRLPMLLRDLAETDRVLGDWPGALENARRAVQVAEQLGSPLQQSIALEQLALVLLTSGDAAQALSLAIASASLAYEHAAFHELVDLTTTVALCCFQLRSPDLGRRLYGAAMYLTTRYDARPSFLEEKTDELDRLLSDAGLPAPIEVDVPIPVLLDEAAVLLQP